MLPVPRRREQFEILGVGCSFLSDKIVPPEVGRLGVGFSKAVSSPMIPALSWDIFEAC